MPTPTYDLLASSVLTTATSSVTFASISQDFRDLVLVLNYTHTANANSRLKFNSISTGYSGVSMVGNGSSATSGSGGGGGSFIEVEVFQPLIGNKVLSVVSVFDYTATDKHKSILQRVNNPARATEATAWRWADTSAINAISIEVPTGNFDAGSTFHLYGIAS